MKRTAFIFLIFIIILSFSLKAYSLMEPIDPVDPRDIMVKIEQGMTGREIAELLEEKEVIKSSTMFYLLLRFKQVDNLQAGYYRFSTSKTPLEIMDKLQRGDEMQFKITIPEGFTLEEILNRFVALKLPEYERKVLENEINKEISKIEIERSFEKKISESEEFYPAEGFIIPNTYNFPVSYDEQDIAKSLINYFIAQRQPVLKKAAADSNYSAYQLLIIASLIEEEGKLAAENKLIASVIYNRLERGMPLQLDATVQYALPARTERVLYEDLEVDSPYNTYLISKLPPTPIANPGKLAVKAAINPAESDYLFYFAREDDSHVFTESYEEHLQKQRELN
ncbi:endolytic transglycosylase MltG [Halanaerobium saccharolyticum]|uniref:endolytic transglycosylase MltG n=1 Tax=Halanaerobium saccharolyticum TaxID=43595 RepID=UPI00105C9984|nr:endolytic transglycosylase MltG [Halanaerobium saccharolyticum]